jgi:hypothetical protein
MINPDTDPTLAASTSAPDANFPFGGATNDAVPGDFSGTPWVSILVNDIWGLFQALVTNASIVPSGSPDNSSNIAGGSSQLLTAIEYIARNILTLNDSAGNTILDLSVDETLTSDTETIELTGATAVTLASANDITLDTPLFVSKNVVGDDDSQIHMFHVAANSSRIVCAVGPDAVETEAIDFIIDQDFSGGEIVFRGRILGGASTETYIVMSNDTDGHSVALYFEDVKRIVTTDTGVQVTGNVDSTGTCTSDERLKNVKGPLDPFECLDRVLARKPISYEWKKEAIDNIGVTSGLKIGFTAQDIQKLEPQNVFTYENEKLGEVLAIRHDAAATDLYGSVQALKAIINDQQTQIHTLTSSIDELRALIQGG